MADRPRSGPLRRITDEQVEALVARTLGQAPPTGVRTGRHVRWPRRRACRSRPSPGSGGRSASSRTSWRPGSCRPTRSSWPRSATWWASTSPRQRTLWSWRQLADVTAPRRSVGWVHAEARTVHHRRSHLRARFSSGRGRISRGVEGPP
ncbi:hypothetical protein [Streptomyces noursei]|uniref:hypothetical protein n=1 Tax=Streptomyces noursei TaxID=1971 RepID=UPI0035E2628B